MQSNELFTQRHTILLDGGMGTMLQAAGLKLGARPEELNITDPETIQRIHGMYAAAGSRIINTNTFGASGHKLAKSPYTVEEVIAAGVACCKKACAPYGALTALDIGPLGELLEPNGTLPFETAVAEFARIVRAGAAARRRFLDTALCQLRPNYARYLEEYNRLHEHKTRILRDSEEKPSLLSMWEDFSLRMARIGAQIIRYRAYYCRRLLAAAAAVYSDIAPHEALSGVYRTVSSVSDPFASAQQLERELIDHVFRHKNAEIAAKSCLSGPHKDDLELLLDGRSASAFASQGQVRTCTLSLKLAERELFFEEDGEYPVLLLDDVLSELDRRRQDFVLNRISAGQVMITCCEDGISEKLRAGAAFHIKNGKIV